jgi:TonB family protein
MIWNGTVQGEELLSEPTAVVLGEGPGALFPLPEGVLGQPSITLLEPGGGDYRMLPSPAVGGFVWLRGHRYSVRELQAPVTLEPGDHGVVTFGSVSIFFQQVRQVRGELPRKSFRDGALIACLGLSIFSHVVGLLFLFLVASREFVPDSHLELDAELVRKFMVAAPPEALPQPTSARGGTAADDPGLRDRDEQGGKRAREREGRIGRADAKSEQTRIAGPATDAVTQKVRGMGLLGALSGGGERGALADALNSTSVEDLLGGLGAASSVTGRGSGGMSLKGSGKGGGGQGDGALLGAGKLGTGVAGGKGLGRGKRGAGSKGRQAREVRLSLGGKGTRVSGFLSREQIMRVVRANQAAIRYCYETALQRAPGLQGEVRIFWRIDMSGRVAAARIAKSTLGNGKAEGCMVRQVKRWKFPKPDGGEVEVVFPFVFRGK